MLKPSGLELNRKPRYRASKYSPDPMVKVVNEKRNVYLTQREQLANHARNQREHQMIKAKYTFLCTALGVSIAGALGAPLATCAALGAIVAAGFWFCTEVS